MLVKVLLWCVDVHSSTSTECRDEQLGVVSLGPFKYRLGRLAAQSISGLIKPKSFPPRVAEVREVRRTAQHPEVGGG